MHRFSRWLLSLLVGFAVCSALGQEAEPVMVALEAFIVTEVMLEDGTIQEQFTEAETARPGAVIEYRLTLTNSGSEVIPPGNLSVAGPVPEGTHYLADSATPTSETALLTVSIDGGETFAELPIFIIVTNEQGEAVEVEAGPELFTTLRWSLLEPFALEASHTFIYRVVVQ